MKCRWDSTAFKITMLHQGCLSLLVLPPFSQSKPMSVGLCWNLSFHCLRRQGCLSLLVLSPSSQSTPVSVGLCWRSSFNRLRRQVRFAQLFLLRKNLRLRLRPAFGRAFGLPQVEGDIYPWTGFVYTLWYVMCFYSVLVCTYHALVYY